MTLIIEDGTEVTSANSYVTDAEFTTYATARGYTVGADATAREITLIKAMDYLVSLESNFKGNRVTSTQSLSFPRYDVYLNGYYLDSNVIPQELKNAQMELAYQLSTEEILVNETVSNLESFDVKGVYSESYGGSGSTSAVMTRKANAYLNALLKPIGGVYRA